MRMVITPKEAAEELQISINEVMRLLGDGRIDAFKVGNRWKIPSERLKVTIEQWAMEESEKRRGQIESCKADGCGSYSGDNRIRRLL